MNIMEKLASARWVKYLKGAGKDVEKLKGRAGDLLRESRPTWGNTNMSQLEQAKKDIDRGNVSKDVTGYIKSRFKPVVKGTADKPVSELTKSEVKGRKYNLEETRDGSQSRHGLKEYGKEKGRTVNEEVKKRRKQYYKGSRPEGHPEEYMNIVHGGEHSKIKHFVNTGNTKNVTENVMATKKTSEPLSREGLMFHSKVTDRAPDYANTHASPRLGNPAVLAGRIKKKHLYRNGDSDEYSLPKHLYNKIEDAKVYTPKDKEYHTGDFYSHIKAPGIKKQAALPGAVPRVMSGLINKKVMSVAPLKPKLSTFAKPNLTGGGTKKIAKEDYIMSLLEKGHGKEASDFIDDEFEKVAGKLSALKGIAGKVKDFMGRDVRSFGKNYIDRSAKATALAKESPGNFTKGFGNIQKKRDAAKVGALKDNIINGKKVTNWKDHPSYLKTAPKTEAPKAEPQRSYSTTNPNKAKPTPPKEAIPKFDPTKAEPKVKTPPTPGATPTPPTPAETKKSPRIGWKGKVGLGAGALAVGGGIGYTSKGEDKAASDFIEQEFEKIAITTWKKKAAKLMKFDKIPGVEYNMDEIGKVFKAKAKNDYARKRAKI